jgi:hypothetical protein
MKNVAAALLAAGVVALALFAAYYGGILGNRVQANYNKRVVTSQIQQRVRTPGFAQAAYERFFALCSSVQTAEVSIEQQKELLARAVGSDRQRLEINVAGLVANRADAVNTYNTLAREYTSGQFLDQGLPTSLSLSYSKEAPTTCAA